MRCNLSSSKGIRRAWFQTLAIVGLGWALRPLAAFAGEAVEPLPHAGPAMPPLQPASAALRSGGRVEVWIDLAMPSVSAMPSLTPEERVAYGRAIDARQSALIEQLRPWDAEERGRVTIIRNAIVVEVPEPALDEIRRLPGVARVQKVLHPHRINAPKPGAD